MHIFSLIDRKIVLTNLLVIAVTIEKKENMNEQNDYCNDPAFLVTLHPDANLNCRAVCGTLWNLEHFYVNDESLKIPMDVLKAINKSIKALKPIDYEHIGYFVAVGSGLYNPQKDTGAILHRLGMGTIKRLTDSLAAKLMASIPKH